MELDFEFELSKGKQNSLGETLKVVEHIQNNIKEIDKLFLCFFSNNSLVAMRAMNATTVSYTHLTLPTTLTV